MREFSKVSPLLWRDKRFQGLASSDARLAFFYFSTCEHQTSAGCYRLPDGYAANDLGWDTARYQAARKEITSAGLILFDEDTSEIFVAGWFKENPITNGKHATGTSRLIMNIQSDTIREAAEEGFIESRDTFESARAEQKQGPSNVSRLANSDYLNRRA
ncbi:hypothetical protein LJR235_002373 [Pararhizobium sp. LjRoot235]|uniref:hypothetical protein n=1 Tax=Pararhizobium sp. LjRoot235 TaxID=3342291 RepID=UPI003ECECD38